MDNIEKTDFKKVGEGIRLERLKQRMSQKTLGDMVGLSSATIANTESNAGKALYKNIITITEALGIKLGDISY